MSASRYRFEQHRPTPPLTVASSRTSTSKSGVACASAADVEAISYADAIQFLHACARRWVESPGRQSNELSALIEAEAARPALLRRLPGFAGYAGNVRTARRHLAAQIDAADPRRTLEICWLAEFAEEFGDITSGQGVVVAYQFARSWGMNRRGAIAAWAAWPTAARSGRRTAARRRVDADQRPTGAPASWVDKLAARGAATTLRSRAATPSSRSSRRRRSSRGSPAAPA